MQPAFKALPTPSRSIVVAYDQIAHWEGSVAETRATIERNAVTPRHPYLNATPIDLSGVLARQEASLAGWRRQLAQAEQATSRGDLMAAWDYTLRQFEGMVSDSNQGNKPAIQKIYGELVQRYTDLLMLNADRVRAVESAERIVSTPSHPAAA